MDGLGGMGALRGSCPPVSQDLARVPGRRARGDSTVHLPPGVRMQFRGNGGCRVHPGHDRRCRERRSQATVRAGGASGMSFYVGLDLGQSNDFTALAVVQSSAGEDKELRLRHLERYPLRTPYTEIADGVVRLVRDPALTVVTERLIGHAQRRPPELVVDNTGVGLAVTDLLRERGLTFRPVTITGGDVARASETQDKGRHYRVPKRDLVAALEVPFHTGTLKVAEGLPLWPTLREELLNFRRKIDLKTAHDSYEHWRESDHDDLVLACALACWWARRVANRPTPRARPAPSPFGKRRPSPTDPPKYLGGDGRFAHGAQVGRDGAATGGAREPSVRGGPSGPTFRPEDFGL